MTSSQPIQCQTDSFQKDPPHSDEGGNKGSGHTCVCGGGGQACWEMDWSSSSLETFRETTHGKAHPPWTWFPEDISITRLFV